MTSEVRRQVLLMNRRQFFLAATCSTALAPAITREPAPVSYAQVFESYPLDYYPASERELNTVGRCVHSSVENILKASGKYAKAREWEQSYTGGEYSSRLAQRLEDHDIEFAMETGGDDRFLDWMCGRRYGGAHRMGACTLLGAHVLNLVAIDRLKAYYLNNWRKSDPEGRHSYLRSTADEMGRAEFVADWRRRGGWAFTILAVDGEPLAPPIPRPYTTNDSRYRTT